MFESFMKAVSVSTAVLFQMTAAQTGKVSVDPSTRFLIDGAGRSVLFHGVNVVYKVAPYIPTTTGPFTPDDSLNDYDIQNLVDWGQNFVRLGVMWEAVERTEGVYDENYLDQVESLINKLGEAGIYTLVDAHQDVFARSICGEGVPDFYAKAAFGKHPVCISHAIDYLLEPLYKKMGFCINMNDYGYGVDENGDYLIADCQERNFATYYSSPQSEQAFKALYDNTNGLQDAFVSYWDRVSARFAGNKFVVGYDPLNEPGPGDGFQDVYENIPGYMDRHDLAPMFSRVQEKYLANSAESVMWFEPVPYPDEIGEAGGFVFPVGYEVPPGGEIGSPNHVLNAHTYCCQLSTTMCADGQPQTSKAAECLAWHEKRIGQRSLDAQRLGVPLMITEFGACLTEGPCSQEINQVGDVCDANLVGWAYWEFKTYEDLTTSAGTGSEGFYNKDGSLQNYKVKALARTYSMATQGVPTFQDFSTTTGSFAAAYKVDTDIAAETTIYTNREYWYPSGYDYEITRTDLSTVLDASQYQLITTDDRYFKLLITDSSLDGVEVQVSITAKAAAIAEEFTQ